jgi:hypothetical protein
MSDEAFAAPTSSQTGAAMTPSEGDYDAICAAVMETVRGRWFLTEYSRRNRHADTQLVLAALDRIERGLRGEQTPESVERLRNDLMEMARAIARAKAEIAGVSPADEGHPIGDVGVELDSVVRATDEATSNILAAAAQIQEVAWTMREQGNDAGLCDQLSTYAATIQTVASSQKLAGERTQKVVDVMRDLEGRINDMIDVWGGYPAVDNRLLANSARNTPALPPADFGQVEIDTTTDVEPQPDSSDERDADLRDLSLSTASQEASRPGEPRYLNDNGRARSANGHLVLDPSIAAAIRDAASLTNTAETDVNAAATAQVAQVADTDYPAPGTPQDEGSGDGQDADPSKALEPTAPPVMRELPDPQAVDVSHDLKKAMGVEAREQSELTVSESAVSADADAETISPRIESAPTLEVLSEPVVHAVPGEDSTDNEGRNTGSLDAGTEVASAEITASSSGSPQTNVAEAPSSGALAHPKAVAETAAESHQQLEPLAATQPDAHEKHAAQGASAVELPAKPRRFELDLEPLPIGLDAQAPPSLADDTTATGGVREISGGGRKKEASPTAAEPKPYGWLSEPVTALYDLPPLEVPSATAQPSATTHAARTSDSAPRALQSASRWPFAFLGPRSRTKPTAPTEPAPTIATAPPSTVAAAPAARDKTASAPAFTAPAVAFDLGGPTLVVVAPPAASEPKRPAAAPQPAVSASSAPAVATAALPASQRPAPTASEPSAPAVAVAASPEAPKPDASVGAAPAAPAASQPSALLEAVPPGASEPVAPVVAAAVAAASDPSAAAAAGAPAKPTPSANVKVLRPPPPSDPLAALAALTDEEKLALFS